MQSVKRQLPGSCPHEDRHDPEQQKTVGRSEIKQKRDGATIESLPVLTLGSQGIYCLCKKNPSQISQSFSFQNT